MIRFKSQNKLKIFRNYCVLERWIFKKNLKMLYYRNRIVF
jgi:hypothetical protein